MLHDRTRAQPVEFEVDFFGRRYRGRLSQYLDCMVLFYGAYERFLLSFLRDQAQALRRDRGNVTFVDVGGNVGHHSLFMSGHADQVIAFEPYPPLQELIREKLELNGIQNVELVPMGLGRVDEVLDYHPGRGTNSGAGTFLDRTPGATDENVPLQIVNGDRFFADRNLGRIDLLKIDVEGFEANVLQGLAGRIQQDRPVIVMEFGERTRRDLKSEADLRDLFYPGARIVRLVGRPTRDSYDLAPFVFEGAAEVLIAVLPE